MAWEIRDHGGSELTPWKLRTNFSMDKKPQPQDTSLIDSSRSRAPAWECIPYGFPRWSTCPPRPLTFFSPNIGNTKVRRSAQFPHDKLWQAGGNQVENTTDY